MTLSQYGWIGVCACEGEQLIWIIYNPKDFKVFFVPSLNIFLHERMRCRRHDQEPRRQKTTASPCGSVWFLGGTV